MPPKNRFTKEEMVQAALRVVRTAGAEGLTAKALAAALDTSTQPVFTCFGSMEGVRREVGQAALRLYEQYAAAGLREPVPFFGLGMQHVRFARQEPQLYRLLFLADGGAPGAMAVMERMQEQARPRLKEIYHLTDEEADRYFRDLWLVVYSLAALHVTGGGDYSEQETGRILTGFSIAVCKAIKEVPGFVEGTFNRDAVFRRLVQEEAPPAQQV